MKMNKTIIAVLAVFLVLAAFVGATTAAEVIYPYTKVDALDGGKAIYLVQDPAKIITANESGYILTSDFTKGVYKLVSSSPSPLLIDEFYLTNPDATIQVNLKGTTTSVVGKTVSSSSGLDFIVTPARAQEAGNNFTTKNISSLWFTTPAGGKTSFFGEVNSKYTGTTPWSGSTFTVSADDVSDATPGTWSVQLKYKNIDGSIEGISKTSATAYKFTIASTADSITVDKDSITRGNSVLVTVSGTPGQYAVIDINKAGLYILPGQSNVKYTDNFYIGSDIVNTTQNWVVNDVIYPIPYNDANSTKWTTAKVIVLIPGSGKATMQFDTNSKTEEDSYKFTAKFYSNNTSAPATTLKYEESKKTASVSVKKGEITIKAGSDSYYIGNEITVSGINTETKYVYLYMKGLNKDLQQIPVSDGEYVTDSRDNNKKDYVSVNSDNTWEKKFTIANEFDAGTYTFYASTEKFTLVYDADEMKDTKYVNTVSNSYKEGTYATCAITLKQPFLTATAASNYIATGDEIKITGQVEGTPDDLYYYVFGTNYFVWNKVTPEDDGTYEIKVDTAKLGMESGQYFVVIQHPMYDKLFNIQVSGNAKDGYVAEKYVTGTDGKLLGTASKTSAINTRQSANAAQALCDLIDEEYVDDIYVKLDFTVKSAYVTINAIADQKQGTTFTVSGTTNVAVDGTVTVDVISTKFQAESKASISASSYLVQNVKVVAGSNGVNTYSATFDSTPLDIDEYTAVATIVRASSSNIDVSTIFNIVSAPATPTATATGTTAPTTPTATATQTPAKTPGFGALIALAGLGAVAVLVLRRQ